ncbi:hypothetical protein SDJN03_29593, partial [Cucurbita argyrosperma subsp. sororia]
MSVANRSAISGALHFSRLSSTYTRSFTTSSPSPSTPNPNAPAASTKIKRRKKKNLFESGTHGKAWGIAHKDGTPIAEAPKKISGVHKRCWKYIASLPSSGDSDPSAEVQTS